MPASQNKQSIYYMIITLYFVYAVKTSNSILKKYLKVLLLWNLL